MFGGPGNWHGIKKDGVSSRLMQEINESGFLMIVNQVLGTYGLSLADCKIDFRNHIINVEADIPREKEIEIASAIADIVEN